MNVKAQEFQSEQKSIEGVKELRSEKKNKNRTSK